ncbi:short chain dehydrogenase/ reductase-like protein [Amniculicola lignicola CBS 123094]|uniref:Short chain dehydrogenase/ reductase-like protein n=1 Tax=Amniculicola lignicola CBS 123094 TaxID=1392246 RepID=A0A6A5WHM5_9PLEO|nr:short chain dehydrogenase/ reductase-like protein [Amniculicola lignicola CBS 123094]
MSLKNKNVLITGASMGIGAAIAKRLAKSQANPILSARSGDKLYALAKEIGETETKISIYTQIVDIQSHASIDTALKGIVEELGPIDILINNADLTLGAPAPFPDLKIEDIITMTGTNINGMMFTTYAVLNSGGMRERGTGMIINITSTTALEVPPFPGESVYHSCKAAQEGFTNSLRTELVGTNIKVVALRPDVVATNFHGLRVGFDGNMYEEFMRGFEPLVAGDVAETAAWVLEGVGGVANERVCVKAVDVVRTAQRSLSVFDRGWNERNGAGGD